MNKSKLIQVDFIDELKYYLIDADNYRNAFRPNFFDLEAWYNVFDYKCLDENKHELIKSLYCFNFSADRRKVNIDYHLDRRQIELKRKETKWSFTGSIFNEGYQNIRKLKSKLKYNEICEEARLSHFKYALFKINQAILLIHDCVYIKDARKIRFEFNDHLEKMMERQRSGYDLIQKEYGMDDIGEDYIISMIKPLSDLLNEILLKEYCTFIKAVSKTSTVRLLIRLEYYMENGYIVSTSNYKTFIELLQDAKLIGDADIEYLITKYNNNKSKLKS